DALAHVERAPPDIAVEALAVDQLHGEVRLRSVSAIRRPRLVDARDAGVLQAPKHERLLLEPAQQLRRGVARPDHPERHAAPRLALLGLVHDAHSPLAEHAEDAIGAEDLGHGGAARPRCERGAQSEVEWLVAHVLEGPSRARSLALQGGGRIIPARAPPTTMPSSTTAFADHTMPSSTTIWSCTSWRESPAGR